MKKKRNKMKKRISLFVAALLAAGAAMPVANYVMEARADANKPDIRYFADADKLAQLKMGSGNEALVEFGELKGKTAEWYIIDKDPNLDEDNVILFSKESYVDTAYQTYSNPDHGLIPLQRSYGEYPSRVEMGETPAYPLGPTDTKYDAVYLNHYGASTLRNELIKLANGSTFSSVKNLMLETELSYSDAYNKTADGNYDTYTITDRLYTPAVDPASGELLFGSGMNVVVDKDTIADGLKMWTATNNMAEDTKDKVYMFDNTQATPTLESVSQSGKAYPAFALDLSQVLFGSVVGDARTMTQGAYKIDAPGNIKLRLDGVKMGTISTRVDVAYNASQISYKNVPSNSRIVIQGKGLPGDTSQNNVEWYWCSSPLINANGTITSDVPTTDITTALLGQGATTGQNLDFSKCEIWLETREQLAGMPYAIKGHKGVVTQIILEGIDEPAAGERLAPEAVIADETKGITGGTSGSKVSISWRDSNGNALTGAYDQTYTADVNVTLADGYRWPIPSEDDGFSMDDLKENTIIRLSNGKEMKCIDIKDMPGNDNVKTLSFTWTIDPNRDIEYEVWFDGVPVTDPAQGIRCIYDGEKHNVEIVVKTAAGVSRPVYSFEEAGSGNNPDPNYWSSTTLDMIDAGKYTIYFQIPILDDRHDPVDATTDNSAVKPISVTIDKRKVWIHPDSQKIPWTEDLTINPFAYEMRSESGESGTSALVKGHSILDVVLTPEMGAIINKDDIISEGWIMFYPTTKDADNNDVPNYKVVDAAGNDVTKNYDVDQAAPGELVVLHNENLPPKSISVEKAKTTYKLGEALTVNDLKVIARYGDGYSELVPRGGGHDSLTTNEEDIDMTTLGGKALKVTYTREEPAAARGFAEESLTINVVEEEDPAEDPGDDTPNSNDPNGGSNNDPNNNTSYDPNNNSNNPNSTGTATNPGTSARAANDQTSSGTSTGTGTSSGTNSTSGTSNKTTTASGARTGDTSPIVMWVLAALCSGIVVVSLMIFNMGRGTKKKKSKK